MPRIIIIAGPNGAGKTTFAREYLPQEAGCATFVNADLIAAGLSPFAPEQAALQAGRLMLAAIARHVASLTPFAFETTLSGRAYARQIPSWQRAGFVVELLYLGLPSADMAVARVAERVRQGGHAIPEATIRRRFETGRRLLVSLYQPLVDRWAVYDSAGEVPVLLEWSGRGTPQSTEPTPVYGRRPDTGPADFSGATAALRRAAARARELAEQTGTDLVVVRAGRLVRLTPGRKGRG